MFVSIENAASKKQNARINAGKGGTKKKSGGGSGRRGRQKEERLHHEGSINPL